MIQSLTRAFLLILEGLKKTVSLIARRLDINNFYYRNENMTNRKEDLRFIEDAEIVLEFALRKKVDLDKSILEKLARFKSSVKKSNDFELTEYIKEKQEFWNSYQKIISQLKFDTECILEIEKKTKFLWFNPEIFGLSRATKTLSKYKIGLLLVLLITLSLHFYWFNGLSYFQNYENIQSKLEILQSNLDISDTSKIEYTKVLKVISEVEKDEIDVIRSLCKWEDFNLFFVDLDDKASGMHFSNIKNCDGKDCLIHDEKNKIIRSVVIKLRLFDTYILPLLYGLLGAIIFSTRNISTEIKNYTFNRFSKTNYATRLFLGLFAGIAIGWFGNSDAITSSEIHYSLTPILLAFIAGYNIEILFSAIDKYVKGLKNSSTRQLTQ